MISFILRALGKLARLVFSAGEVLAARHERIVVCHCPKPCGAIVDGAKCDTGRIYRVPDVLPRLPD